MMTVTSLILPVMERAGLTLGLAFWEKDEQEKISVVMNKKMLLIFFMSLILKVKAVICQSHSKMHSMQVLVYLVGMAIYSIR